VSSGGHEASVLRRSRVAGRYLTPDNNLFVERAIADVIALLAAYDRDRRLATRWEERFANAWTTTFRLASARHTGTDCGAISRSKEDPPAHQRARRA